MRIKEQSHKYPEIFFETILLSLVYSLLHFVIIFVLKYADSLNSSVAVIILIYEALKQTKIFTKINNSFKQDLAYYGTSFALTLPLFLLFGILSSELISNYFFNLAIIWAPFLVVSIYKILPKQKHL